MQTNYLFVFIIYNSNFVINFPFMNYSRKSRNATQTQRCFTVLLVLDLSECLNIRSTFVEKEKKI